MYKLLGEGALLLACCLTCGCHHFAMLLPPLLGLDVRSHLLLDELELVPCLDTLGNSMVLY